MSQTQNSPDRIVKSVVLDAPRSRVWQALTDSRRFGTWFGVELDGPFALGQDVSGRIVPTQVDEEVARLQEPHRGVPWNARVERLEPMDVFAFSWRPYPLGQGQGQAPEASPATLVTFELQDAGDGVKLTITESGLQALGPELAQRVFEGNSGGWEHQMRLIGAYLARADAR
ncbi:MAG TPA: SRPBCC family protein [Caulobacteraceae bacterium]|nr:SRPBCC family protein [Caulobacteraceae bacterium]